jgi:hypothetical protein
MSRCYLSIPALILPLALANTGCGPAAPAGSNLDATEKAHLLHVVALATDYATANKKQPASLEELKTWALKEGKGTEEEFNSTRDKQPYGLSSGMGGIQVYEQTGKGGKVYIFMMGGVHEQMKQQVGDVTKRMQTVGPNRGIPSSNSKKKSEPNK